MDTAFNGADRLPDSSALNLDRRLSPSIHHDDVGPELFECPPRLFLANMIRDKIADLEIPSGVPNHVGIVLQLKET